MMPETSVPKTQRLTEAERRLMVDARTDGFGGMRLAACVTLATLATIILFVAAVVWWLLFWIFPNIIGKI